MNKSLIPGAGTRGGGGRECGGRVGRNRIENKHKTNSIELWKVKIVMGGGHKIG